MKKLEAERLPIFHQWKDRNNLSFNNLDGNLRTSNRKTNSFLPGIAHAVPLSTTEIGSLWGAGEFSYQSCDIIGCRRELLVPWAQGTWGKKLLRVISITLRKRWDSGHSISPSFPLFTWYTFYFHFYSQTWRIWKCLLQCNETKKAAQPHHSLHPQLPTKTSR